MSTASHDYLNRPPLEPIVRQFTVADLAAMSDEIPSGTVKHELDNGRLIMTPPPGSSHGSVQLALASELRNHVNRKSLGRVWVETGVILWRNPDRVVGPDVTFVSAEKLPVKLSAEGYLETIPDLVAEVRSKNDTLAYLRRKMEDYLRVGVRAVLIVEPESKQITIHRSDATPQTLAGNDTLILDDILSGFSLPLAELFKD